MSNEDTLSGRIAALEWFAQYIASHEISLSLKTDLIREINALLAKGPNDLLVDLTSGLRKSSNRQFQFSDEFYCAFSQSLQNLLNALE